MTFEYLKPFDTEPFTNRLKNCLRLIHHKVPEFCAQIVIETIGVYQVPVLKLKLEAPNTNDRLSIYGMADIKTLLGLTFISSGESPKTSYIKTNTSFPLEDGEAFISHIEDVAIKVAINSFEIKARIENLKNNIPYPTPSAITDVGSASKSSIIEVKII